MPVDSRGAPSSARPGRRRFNFSWIGLLPFLLFSVLFLIIPTSYLVVGSFQDQQGQFTVQNYADLTQPLPLNSYLNSIEISLVTAILGGLFGFLMAYAVIRGGLHHSFRGGLLTFSGVASNFAGVPLALAFIFTLGRVGFLTVFLRDILGVNIYEEGFSL